MSITNQQILQDFQVTSPDAQLIAEEWRAAALSIKPNVPSAADLAETITGIGQDFTMQGAPQLEIDILDQEWVLLDSGFFDPADQGTLDRIDIQYGVRASDNEPYFWRIFQYSPKSDYTVQTYWVPRVVCDFMNLNARHNPISANRSTRTRAQFLKMCANKVPYARFHCQQLDKVQPIAPLTIPTTGTSLKAATNAGKTVGISKSVLNASNLTVQGQPMGERQRQAANTLLRVADQLGAGKIATEALIYAGIWESNLEVYADNGTFWGVLSGKIGVWSQGDTTGMAKAFLQGNSAKGYQAGGAIALSATVTNPIQIAVEVEVPSIWPNNAYSKNTSYPKATGGQSADALALAEVDAIIQAGGGATGDGGVAGQPTEPVQQYNFQIGTTADPNEDYWTGMNRIAQEVNWELVVDGDDIYYDSDVTLCRAQIDAVIDRNDETVGQWSFDWDRTQLPTNFQMELQCQPFDFSAANVFQLKNFGPASNGSSIKLPGRWLVGEIQRNPGDIVATFTLVQPTQPLQEPAPLTGVPTTKPDQVTITGKSVNPFIEATSLVPERVDDGKDYSMAPGSPILAPFDSQYLGVRVANWYAGQPLIGFKIIGGTYNGWCYYFAEQITPAQIKVGSIIKAGTTIATYAASGTGIECGLLDPVTQWKTLAQANGHGGQVPSPEGTRWEGILKALGAPV